MATLDDILTTQKNGVVAINNLNQTTSSGLINTSVNPSVPYLSSISSGISTGLTNITKLYGTTTSATVTSSTLVIAGAGRLVNFSVTVAGTTAGTINNSATTGAAAASNALVAVPTTIGVYQTGQHFSDGLVIVPGTGQSINVTYSTD